MKKSKTYNYFYKITNTLNGHYYYGIHSTDNLNDGYMGSGRRLNLAYKKYGKDVFVKEIIKFFNTRKEAALYESEIVTEVLIKDSNCYNLILGGETRSTSGTATVKDKNGNIYQLPVDDNRILSGEFVGVTKGTITVIDNDGKSLKVSVDDERYKNGTLSPYFYQYMAVKDKKGNKIVINSKDFDSNIYDRYSKGTVLVKDNNNNNFIVDVNDERLLSGELKLFWVGRNRTEETKRKQRETYKLTNHQKGEKNSQFGTCWITKDNVNKKIKKHQLSLYESQGWCKGRVIKNKK